MSWQTNPPTQADLDKFDDQRAAEASTLANQARNFYTQFPGDENAARARTTEIQALQLAVRLGLTNREPELITRENSFVADTNAPMDLRYQLKLDLIGRQLKAKSDAGADMNAELEKAGREMVNEFPDGPAGYEILWELAENADLLKMHDYATAMANSGGPAELTGIGQGLLNRLELVGKPMPLDFTAIDGRKINLMTLSNKVVLVDFWGTWCPVCVQEMPDIKKLYDEYHASGFEIVGIDYDENTNIVQQFVQKNDLPWPQEFVGRDGTKYVKQYSINFFPSVWLLDKKGIVRDIHGRIDTEAKIKKLLAE